MASATYTNISPNYANFQLVLKLSSTANVSANTSTVNYDCYIQVVAAASNYRYNNGNSCSISINGTSIVNTSNIGSIQCNNTPVGTRVVTLASGSMTVPHGSDGKKSIAFSASFRQTQSWGTAAAVSGTFALDNIPRTSKPSVSSTSVNIGSAVTINTNRAVSSFTHTLQYKVGSGSYTNIATGVGASYSWTLPASIGNSMTNSTSATITINCITYSGNTQIGSSTCTLTANAPSSWVPTISSITLADGNNRLSGFYLQNLSTLKVTVNSPAGSNGSTISSYSIKVTDPSGSVATYTAQTSTTAVLSKTGTYSVSVTVMDSRGRTSAAKTGSITVTAYAQPTITNVSLLRTNSSGTEQYDGTSMKLIFTYLVTSIKSGSTEKNTCSAKWKYKAASASSYGSDTSVGTVVGTATTYTGVVASGALDPETAYNVVITVADKWSTVPYMVNLSVAAIPIDLNATGTGMGLMSPADVDDAIHIGKKLIFNDANGTTETITFNPVIVSTW